MKDAGRASHMDNEGAKLKAVYEPDRRFPSSLYAEGNDAAGP